MTRHPSGPAPASDFRNKSQEQMIEYAVRMRKRAEKAEALAERLGKEREEFMRQALRWKEVAQDLGGVGYEYRCAVKDCEHFATFCDVGEAGEVWLCNEHRPEGSNP